MSRRRRRRTATRPPRKLDTNQLAAARAALDAGQATEQVAAADEIDYPAIVGANVIRIGTLDPHAGGGRDLHG